MMYKVEPGKPVKETNPELTSIPEFNVLNDNKLRYVIFFTDYQSPLRKFPEPERKRLSALQAGYPPQDSHQKTFQPKVRDIINGKDEEVNAAIEKYKKLQYNEDREDLLIIQRQINNIKEMVKRGSDDPAELKKINDLLTSLPALRATIKELAVQAGLEESLPEIEEESRNLNTLEKVIEEQMKSE